MLNDFINIDLHIHSFASRFKESPLKGDSNETIVHNSTIENLNTLFDKLNEYKIALFSFTDHNVFSADLYRAAKNLIEQNKLKYRLDHPELSKTNYNDYKELYPREILPGVEFDVRLKGASKKGHVLVIFNQRSEEDIDTIQKLVFSDKDFENAWQVEKLSNKESRKKLIKNDSSHIEKIRRSNKDFYFEWSEFSGLLYAIGCSAIIIGEQRSEMIKNGHSGKGHSDIVYSGDSEDSKISSLGVISALEYSSPNNESVILRDLKTLGIPEGKSLFIGSDCHDWTAYPYRQLPDNNDINQISHEKSGFPCCVKALPNYNGLLMCVTSPKTRFMPKIDFSSSYLHSISINGDNIKLSPGINTIIGENGSGKTFLLRYICDNHIALQKQYKAFYDKNNLALDGDFSNTSTYISQGELTSALNVYGSGVISALKKENEFGDIDNSIFEETYNKYTNDLFSVFKSQIEFNEALTALKDETHTLRDIKRLNSQKWVVIEYDDHWLETNVYKKVYLQLEKVKVSMNNVTDESREILLKLDEKNEYLEKFKNSEKNINEIMEALEIMEKQEDDNIIIVGYIKSATDEYNNGINELMNMPQKEIKAYNDERKKIISSIVKCCTIKNKLNSFPKFPGKISNGSIEHIYGEIKLIKEAKYYNCDLEDTYQFCMFYSKMGDIKSLKKVATISELCKIIKRQSAAITLDQIRNGMLENLENFYKKNEEVAERIVDTSDSKNQESGATPGQQSLSFFKCLVASNDTNKLIVIDQPEDNISQKNIAVFLSNYLRKLAYDSKTKHQLFVVTHNPYIVVNADSDNVVCLTCKNQKIKCVSGCLEDEDNGIMKFIADNMDGGKKAIEDRLNCYVEVQK